MSEETIRAELKRTWQEHGDPRSVAFRERIVTLLGVIDEQRERIAKLEAIAELTQSLVDSREWSSEGKVLVSIYTFEDVDRALAALAEQPG